MRSKGVRAEGTPVRAGTVMMKTRASSYRQQWGYSYKSHSQV